ncbi:MAG: DUF192 domain-containing protein [Phycisphaerales bacterium]
MAAGRGVMLGLMLSAAANVAGCQRGQSISGTEQVTIAGELFHLEVASDDSMRAQGLMGRTEIASDGGMLFIFSSPQVRQFWMGYCVVDIDIMFLDPNGRVTAIHTMKTEDPRKDDESELAYRKRLADYPSVYATLFAIELRAGSIERLGVNVDDKIELDLARLKAMAH